MTARPHLRLLAFSLVLLALSSCAKSAPSPQATSASAPAPEAGQDVEGAATRVTGSVQIQAPGGEWKPLAVRGPVPSGSRIRAGADGEADVLLTSQGAVRLKPGTEIEVTQNRVVNGAPQIAVRVDAGRLLHRFGRLGSGASYRVVTPAATAGIRGTEFDVTAEAGQSRIRVLSGKVEIENPAGRGVVSEKEGSTIGAGQAPPAPSPLAQSEIDALQECSLVRFTAMLERTRRVATAAEMRNVSVPLEVWAASHDGRYPNTLQEGGADGYADNWNQPYRYEVTGGGAGFIIISNGPDRQPNTDDDLEYRRD